MTCSYSPSGNLVASGGLNNTISVYSLKVRDPTEVPLSQELTAHTGYISSCQFVGDDTRILSTSGDQTNMLWDVQTGASLATFTGHSADVMDAALGRDPNMFISVSCDKTARVWDIRQRATTMIFTGHSGDLNSVTFMPNQTAFGTGSDDSSCHLFDMRSYSDLAAFGGGQSAGVTSVDFSASGRLMFAGYDDYACQVWDVIKGEKIFALPHENLVSCIGITSDGLALATGSWDTLLKVWSPGGQS